MRSLVQGILYQIGYRSLGLGLLPTLAAGVPDNTQSVPRHDPAGFLIALVSVRAKPWFKFLSLAEGFLAQIDGNLLPVQQKPCFDAARGKHALGDASLGELRADLVRMLGEHPDINRLHGDTPEIRIIDDPKQSLVVASGGGDKLSVDSLRRG
ncbi:hypothetical protein [Methylacidimicrobium sp. AP8]|uniref:hypothetical protein n=1 Tax=Methylacidimicrobium sp. AP8 TaxID=2730359 RepID=UPI001921C91B|nr:hypothetical protein [Methylacidimicrobium sp. AP8]